MRLPIVQQRKVESIMNWDMTQVEHSLINEDFPKSYISKAIEEFRKFMVIQLLAGDKPLAMTNRLVDEVWHKFILFTREYHDFCEKIFGYYIHHSPNTNSNSNLEVAHSEFIELYESVYGDSSSFYFDINSANVDCKRELHTDCASEIRAKKTIDCASEIRANKTIDCVSEIRANNM